MTSEGIPSGVFGRILSDSSTAIPGGPFTGFFGGNLVGILSVTPIKIIPGNPGITPIQIPYGTPGRDLGGFP